MSGDISVAEVDQAASAMMDAKTAYYDSGQDPKHKQAFNDAKNKLNDLRTAWRAQEEAAGRRDLGHTAGGDAFKVEG